MAGEFSFAITAKAYFNPHESKLGLDLPEWSLLMSENRLGIRKEEQHQEPVLRKK